MSDTLLQEKEEVTENEETVESEEESLLTKPEEEEKQLKPGDTLEDGTKVGDVGPNGEDLTKEDSRPDDVPERFWNKDDNQLDSDKLLKSYKELEKKLKQPRKEKAPDKYTFEEDTPPEIVEEFRNLNLTEEQAKGIVDVIQEKITPVIQKERAALEKKKLMQEWGFEEEAEMADKVATISRFAYNKLPEEVVKNLARTAQGVLSLEAMMTASNKVGQLDDGLGTGSTGKVITKTMIEEAVADDRYQTSKTYQQEVQKMAEDYAKQVESGQGSGIY